MTNNISIKRGDVVLVKLDPIVGSEQGKTRPAVIVQNDLGNEFSPTTIIAPITSKIFSRQFPTNVEIDKTNSPLKEKSTILLNQIRTIDESRILRVYGRLAKHKMSEVNGAIIDSLELE